MNSLTPDQVATLADWGITVDDCGVVTSNAPVGPMDARIAKLEADLARETKRANYLMHLLENVERMARGEDPLPAGVRIVEIKTDGTNGGRR